MDDSGWKWVNMDESGWKWKKMDEDDDEDVILWWSKLSLDKIQRSLKCERSDSLWRFACGDVWKYTHSASEERNLRFCKIRACFTLLLYFLSIFYPEEEDWSPNLISLVFCRQIVSFIFKTFWKDISHEFKRCTICLPNFYTACNLFINFVKKILFIQKQRPNKQLKCSVVRMYDHRVQTVWVPRAQLKIRKKIPK